MFFVGANNLLHQQYNDRFILLQCNPRHVKLAYSLIITYSIHT